MNAQPKRRILLILSILAAIFTSSTAFADYTPNGIVESDEECDDKNTDPGDGCSPEGKLEGFDACDAAGANCINIAVILPLAGSASDENVQVIAGLFRPAETNPPADFDTKAQSFKIEVLDKSGNRICGQNFDETELSQAMVRPLWAFKCEGKISVNSKIRVTNSNHPTDASWSYAAPLTAGVSVTSPEDLLLKYNIDNSTVELDSDGQLTKWPTSIPTLGGKYWANLLKNNTMRMHFYKTTPDSNLKFVRTATNIEKPSVESKAGLGWSLKSIANAFESAKKYYGPDESGVFFFQPYFESNEKILSSGRVALRDMMRPNLNDITYKAENNTVSGTVYDGDSEGASGERFATVTVKVEDSSQTEIATGKGITGPDGTLNIMPGDKILKIGQYKITVTATDRAGNEKVREINITIKERIDEPIITDGTLKISGLSDGLDSKITYEIKKDGVGVDRGEANTNSNGAWQTTVSLDGLAPGEYEVVVGDLKKTITIPESNPDDGGNGNNGGNGGDELTGTTAGGCSSTDSNGGLLALLIGLLGMIGIRRRRD